MFIGIRRRRLDLLIVANDLSDAVAHTGYAASTLKACEMLDALPEGITERGVYASRNGKWVRWRTEEMKRQQIDYPWPNVVNGRLQR